jgi:hypothetical protein
MVTLANWVGPVNSESVVDRVLSLRTFPDARLRAAQYVETIHSMQRR